MSDRGSWPKDIVTKSTTETEMEEKRIKEVFAAVISAKDDDQLKMLLTNYNLHNVLRVTAWIKRFIYNTQLKKSVRTGGPLTTDDIERAKIYWIKQTQQEYENADQFQEDKAKLNLQLDKTGIYRCMGRIVGDYPIYLQPKDIFSEKIVEDAHLCTLHGVVGVMMTKVRRRYWIPKLTVIQTSQTQVQWLQDVSGYSLTSTSTRVITNRQNERKQTSCGSRLHRTIHKYNKETRQQSLHNCFLLVV